MKKFLKFLKHEFLEMLPPTLYFLVVFHLLVLIRNLVAEEWDFSAIDTLAPTIGALLVGKAVLLTDAIPFVKHLGRKRLVNDIIFRTILYGLFALFLQFLEEFIPAAIKHDGIAAGAEHCLDEILWPKFWLTHILMLFFLFVYVTATTISHAIGHDNLVKLLSSPKKPPNDSFETNT